MLIGEHTCEGKVDGSQRRLQEESNHDADLTYVNEGRKEERLSWNCLDRRAVLKKF